MKNLFGILIVGLIFITPQISLAEINIFACEPEWKALAEEIGGSKIKAFSATNSKQNPHYLRARPSLIIKARNADMIFCSGAELEVGWLPILLDTGSHKIQSGEIGHLLAADYVPVIEKHKGPLDRSMGDIHSEGNPHVHLNPHNIILVANEFTRRLKLIDKDNAIFYQNQLEDFKLRWLKGIFKWEKEASSLKGSKVIVYHKTFSYLFNWLGIETVASIERKPGIAPTIKDLANLAIISKDSSVKFITRAVHEPKDASIWLSNKTGIKVIVLPMTVEENSEYSNLFTLYDHLLNLIKREK